MALATASVADSVSSSEIPTFDADRHAEIERRQQAVARFLDEQRFDALLLQRPANFAWFTAGADNARGPLGDVSAALFLTREARVVLTSNTFSQELFDQQLSGLGFQLKERPWSESRQGLIDDVCRGRTVAGDASAGRVQDVSAQIGAMRLPLSDFEMRRLRELGRDVAHAVEATARHLSGGMTEAEAAGQLANRLIKHGVAPVRLQAAADGRTRLYRNWSSSDRPIQRCCTLSAVGRRDGLCLGTTRSVSLGDPPADVWKAFSRMALILATGMYFSQTGWMLGESWSRVHRIYEKFGSANEWQLAEQGEVVGYSACEVPVVPRSTFELRAGVPVFWHPSVGAAAGGDTVLIDRDEILCLTAAADPWPILTVEVKGHPVNCPDMLRLPATRAVVRNSGAFLTSDGDSVLNFGSVGPPESAIDSEQEPTESVLD